MKLMNPFCFVSQQKPAVSGNGQVLIRVKSAAINPVDYKLPTMMVGGQVVGLDVAGVVAESTSPLFKVGDEVFGNVEGALADFALCEESKITHKPQQLSWIQAASIGTAYAIYESLNQKSVAIMIIDFDALICHHLCCQLPDFVPKPHEGQRESWRESARYRCLGRLRRGRCAAGTRHGSR